MHKRSIFSGVIFCLLLPVIVIAGYFLAKGKQYYLVSLLVIAVALFPFFFSLERKRLQVRELVLAASIIAIAVASRAAFFFLPQVKPMAAILIICAAAFGPEFGFVSGVLAVLLSNFIFGQGMWTPFQMLGMGLTVYFSALLFFRSKSKNRFLLAAAGGLFCTVVYGGLVDLSTVFMSVSEFTPRAVLAIYQTGLPFNLIHGCTTAAIIALIQPEINTKLERIKIKYGLFQGA